MPKQAQIRAIIFDLGGVLLRTDNREPRTELARRFGMTRRELEKLVFDNLASRQAEVGQIPPEQAWEAIARDLNLPASEIPEFSRQFFAGDRIDFGLIDFIQSLRPRYTTALLSNSWVVDMPKFLTEDLHVPDTFDVIISSAKYHIAKPDPAIFQLALEEVKAAPDEAVFVDDSDYNIAGAAALGIQTVHFRDAEQAKRDILALLNGAEPDR